MIRGTARFSRIASSPSCRRSRRLRYKHSLGQPFIYPRNDLDYCSNLLNMFFAVPCEGYQRRSGRGQGAGPAVDPARRPRAEREHLDRAPGRQHRREPLCGDLRRRRGAVGSRARRRERGGAGDARGDRHGRQHPEVPGHGQGQVQTLPADGLRPPRLQEFRSAREDHPRDLPRGAREARSRPTIRCSNWRCGSRRSRSRTNISSPASSIRTSISIPASSTAHSASRARCSP